MAGTPERLSQPLILTTEAKDRIGSYYLPGLLKNLKHQDYDTAPFERIPWDFLLNDKKVRIPESLSEKLDLKSLRWIAYYDTMLPILLCGKELNNGYFKTDRFGDSFATIEIARRVENVKPTQELEHEDKIPFYLRIAGIDKKENRIIAATYDLTNNAQLLKLNVSIAEEEFSKRKKDDSYSEMLYLMSKAIIPLSFVETRPYLSAGLITPQMHNSINHSYAFSFDLKNFTIFPHRPDSLFNSSSTLAFNELGYYAIRINDGFVRIGLEYKTAVKRDIRPWEISIPEALTKI